MSASSMSYVATSPHLTPGQRMVLAEELIDRARVCHEARPQEACCLLKQAQRELARAAEALRPPEPRP
jgi:hypothetical protein